MTKKEKKIRRLRRAQRVLFGLILIYRKEIEKLGRKREHQESRPV